METRVGIQQMFTQARVLYHVDSWDYLALQTVAPSPDQLGEGPCIEANLTGILRTLVDPLGLVPN